MKYLSDGELLAQAERPKVNLLGMMAMAMLLEEEEEAPLIPITQPPEQVASSGAAE